MIKKCQSVIRQMIPIELLITVNFKESVLPNRFSYTVLILSVSILFIGTQTSFADGPPEPVTDLIAIPADGEVHLIWTAPYNNEVPMQNYKVIMWKTGTDVYTTYPNLSTTTRSLVTGLTNDVSYNFKVIAKNSRGDSPDSNTVSAKPTSSQIMFAPDRIDDLKATRADQKILLSWTTPFNGGTSITGYKIFYWELGSGDIKTKTLNDKANTTQITGLTNEVSYRVKVVAINSMGHGPDSNTVSATPSKSTTAKIPNEVRGVDAFGSDGKVLVAWVRPSENGSPIHNYKVLVSQPDSSAFTTYPTGSSDTQYTITGLQNGVKYGFKVVAINSIGESRPSGTASATPVKAVSIAITNFRAAAGDGKATLTWSLSDDKIEQISGYRIREYTGGSNSFVVHDVLGKATKTTITGLTNGVSYGFSVVAVTNDGLGPSSGTVSVIPKVSQISSGAPGSITNLKATAEENQVRLSWSAPADNGNKITGYNIQQYKKGENFFVTIPKSGTTPSVLITGLTNGVTYDFKAIAINSIGEGPVSNTVSATPGPAESTISIPPWVKNNAKWWSEGLISDLEYVRAIEHLINQGIIKIK